MDSVAKALHIMDENVINSYNISPYIASTPINNNQSYIMKNNVTDSSFKYPIKLQSQWFLNDNNSG